MSKYTPDFKDLAQRKKNAGWTQWLKPLGGRDQEDCGSRTA
jgi:hypothetical protein